MTTALQNQTSNCWVDSKKCPFVPDVRDFRTANFEGYCLYCARFRDMGDIITPTIEVVSKSVRRG